MGVSLLCFALGSDPLAAVEPQPEIIWIARIAMAWPCHGHAMARFDLCRWIAKLEIYARAYKRETAIYLEYGRFSFVLRTWF